MNKAILLIPFVFLINILAVLGYYSCYQETANISTSCGGLNNGTYSTNSSQWDCDFSDINTLWDGDYVYACDAEILEDPTLYINITKPLHSTIYSLWQTKVDTYAYQNLSLAECWNTYLDKVQLKINISFNDEWTRFYCMNKTDWSELREVHNYVGLVDDGGYYWNISTVLNINIYDIDTLNYITSTVTIDFDSDTQVFTNTTNTGTIEIIMPVESYTIDVSADNYDSKTYYLSITESSEDTTLNAYLSNSSLTAAITLTLQDSITTKTIEDALVTVSKKVNLTYVSVDQAYTNIEGQAIFSLGQSEEYRFTISADGYETKIFNLEPVSTSYTILVDPSITIDWETIFGYATYTTLPADSNINASEYTNFSIITSSVSGAIISSFGVNTTYMGNDYSTTVSGSPSGGTASISLNLSNASFSSITVGFSIDVTGYDDIYFDRTFYLSNVTYNNATILGAVEIIDNNTTGTQRAIIAVVLTVLIILTFYGMGIRGNKLNIIAAICIGIFTKFGFIHENPIINGIIGGMMVITLLGTYFTLARIGD